MAVYWYGCHQLEWGVLPPFQHSAALCQCLAQLWHFPLNFPYVMPNSIGTYPPLSYYIGIKTGYFCLFFWAWDYPTVANVNHNCSVACSSEVLGLLGSYPGLHGWL